MLFKVSTEYSKQCDFKQDYVANLLWNIVVGGKIHGLLQKTNFCCFHGVSWKQWKYSALIIKRQKMLYEHRTEALKTNQTCSSSHVPVLMSILFHINSSAPLKLEMEIYFYSSAALYSRCTGSYWACSQKYRCCLWQTQLQRICGETEPLWALA